MRVLFINSFFSVGGPPRIVKGIYDTLVENGDSCLLAAARETPPEEMSTYVVGGKLDTYKAALFSRVFDNEGLSCRRVTERLVEEIRLFDPDVINLHNLHGYYLNFEVLFDYLRAAEKPVVWTLHDCWPFTGHCAYFSYERCDQWKAGCGQARPCPQKGSYPASVGLSRAKRNYARKVDAFTGLSNLTIVTPSRWLGNLARSSFLGQYPIRTIHNGVDLAQFSPARDEASEEKQFGDKAIVLGVAQNWGERKGLDDCVELGRLLGDEFKVVLVGLTQKQLSSLPPFIHGITRTKSVEELARLYSRAAVFVNCTYQDNFPTVNIEALACGTPVLTYETGGSVEAVDETCGRVVPQGNVKAMADAVRATVAEPFASEACVARAKMFDRKDKYMEYRNLFLSVCSHKRVEEAI